MQESNPVAVIEPTSAPPPLPPPGGAPGGDGQKTLAEEMQLAMEEIQSTMSQRQTLAGWRVWHSSAVGTTARQRRERCPPAMLMHMVHMMCGPSYALV